MHEVPPTEAVMRADAPLSEPSHAQTNGGRLARAGSRRSILE
jgi:hypothetical protein